MSKATEKVRFQVLRPIVWKGDRVERGSTLEVTPDEAKELDEEYVKPLAKSKGKATKADESSGSEDQGDQENTDQKPEGGDANEGDEIDV